jgi:hypothetical protein
VVTRILLVGIVLLLGFLTGRATNAVVADWWIDPTKTAAIPDRWLGTVARQVHPRVVACAGHLRHAAAQGDRGGRQA